MTDTFRQLPLMHTGRPAPWRLVAFAFGAAAAAWLAAAVALVAAAPALAAGRASAPAAVLAAHLLGVVFLPLAVTGASWHLLPVMLRNDLRRPRLLLVATGLLALGGPLLALGIARDDAALAAPGGTLLLGGLGVSLWQLGSLLVHAPRAKRLVVSRSAVALSALHAVAAGALGLVVFATDAFTGTAHERAVLVHVCVAVLGWLTLLILAVGRTLAPMLALAPAPSERRSPAAELGLVGGLWLAVGALAAGSWPLLLAATAALAAALAPTGAAVARAAIAGRIGPREGPLAHLLVGTLFLVQVALLVPGTAAGVVEARRAATAAVVLLLVGWACGVVVGHLGKLLSLSAWAAWPPGPRPKQAALYPRRLWQVEACLFAAAVLVLADGILLGAPGVARAGAVLLAASALLAVAGCAETVRRARVRLSRSAIVAAADGPPRTARHAARVPERSLR